MIRAMAPRDWLHYSVSLAVLLVALFADQIVGALAPHPLVYRNLPFPVLNSPVHAGEPILMVVDRCLRDVDTPVYVIARELLDFDDNRRTTLNQTYNTVRLGCETVQAMSVPVPMDQTPGIYIYRGVAIVRGRWVTRDVPWQTEPFEIIPRETRL